MKITEKQQAFLDSLVCQRLTQERGNEYLVANFENLMSMPLKSYIQDEAWEVDKSRSGAIYIIKNQKNEILFYFGLRCGELQTPLNEEELKTSTQLVQDALHRLRFRTGSGSQDEVDAYIESIRKGRPDWDVITELSQNLKERNNKIKDLTTDKHKEHNPHVVRVLHSYPALEMTHFVSNDMAQAFWSRSGIKRRMGEVFFWQFVAAKALEIRELAGCEYLYLFAADKSPNRDLINHYEFSMNFSQPTEVGTNKPRYDFTCEFMCQKIDDLARKREEFFETFNRPPVPPVE